MKKVIERMDGNVRELQRREKAASGTGAATQDKEKKSGGGKWLGLGKKKEKSVEKGDKADEGDEDEDGLRVEQYLLVFLKFISTISASPSDHPYKRPCSGHLKTTTSMN